MAKSIATTLKINSILWARLQQEMDFLHVGDRISLENSDQEYNNQSCFLRMICTSYVARWWDTRVSPTWYEGDRVGVSLRVPRDTYSAWVAACAEGAADNPSRLADCAIENYFERQRAIADAVAQRVALVQDLLEKQAPIEELKELYGNSP